MLATFICDAEVILPGHETIYCNGKQCGWLSSAGFGHTLGKSIGMGYVRSDEVLGKDDVMTGIYELKVASVRVNAEVALEPLVDPEMKKVKV